MNVLRGLLFENMGLKLVALLLAVVVYLHVYTDRPATLTVTFPVEVTDLADSLAIVTQSPQEVSAELKGTGKQLIRLRLAEPRLNVSLAGVGPGHFQRGLTAQDLPMVSQIGLEVSRFIGPQMLELSIDRYGERDVPVAARIEGALPEGATWGGGWSAEPASVRVRGPRSVVARLDSVRLVPVKLDAAHDTLKVVATPVVVPAFCQVSPPVVTLRVPVTRTRR
jgi:YbbR domain-containing protein